MTPHALIPRLSLIACILSLLLPALTAHAQTAACRQFLMQYDNLRQLYARGDAMAVRVPPLFRSLTAADVHEVAARKLRSSGLYEADAAQWLDINVHVDGTQFAILMSLRRWTEDLGYGLPGERAPCGDWEAAASTAAAPDGC